jgi:DNA-binding MarR family transcriptional regulator
MKLESLGYIERHVDRLDRRANQVYLTEKGRSFQPILESTLTQWTTSLTQGFTPEEIQMTYTLLEKMTQNALLIKENLNSHDKSSPK